MVSKGRFHDQSADLTICFEYAACMGNRLPFNSQQECWVGEVSFDGLNGIKLNMFHRWKTYQEIPIHLHQGGYTKVLNCRLPMAVSRGVVSRAIRG